jgi:co-chaperonin GroES (HSP10)
MKLDNYFATFRNVLLQEVQQDKTEGGIYIPSSDFIKQEDKLYLVIKAGKDCIEVKPGDKVRLMAGIRMENITLDKQEYHQVMEPQIIGYFRD